jgi:hypothetical protein
MLFRDDVAIDIAVDIRNLILMRDGDKTKSQTLLGIRSSRGLFYRQRRIVYFCYNDICYDVFSRLSALG